MDLQKGDIILFKVEDDLISKCIGYVTKSDVSHAALYYDKYTLAEMGAPGLCINTFTEDNNGMDVTVMRLNKELDLQQVIKAADVYINKGVKYDYPQLVLLAGLLFYWPLRPNNKFKNLISNVLKYACIKLDRYLNDIIYSKEQEVLMCSQFVYQCYLDCGKDYFIDIQGGLLQNDTYGTRLIDVISEDFDTAEVADTAEDLVLDIDENQIVTELYDAFMEYDEIIRDPSYNSELDTSEEIFSQELMHHAYRFYSRIQALGEKNDIVKPMYSLFVTPADLRYHGANLVSVGDMKITRQVGNDKLSS